MNTEPVTERGPLSWMLECEKCEAAFVSPIRGPQRDKPCPQCGGDIIILGAGYPTRDADGAIVSMDPVSMLSREVAEAMTEGVFEEGPLRALMTGSESRQARRERRKGVLTIGKPLPKAKKRSGKSPTRKVIPVARGHHARWERRMAEPREWTAFDRLEADVRAAHLALLKAREVLSREPRECVIMKHRTWGERHAAVGPEHFADLWRQGWRPE